MSHITLAQQGLAAINSRNYEEAFSKLSKALSASTNPSWLIGRSKALIGLKRYAEALEDAELAWHKGFARNQRTAMTDAQYRRAVAYFRLGQLANADCCCLYAMRLLNGTPAHENQDPRDTWVGEDGTWLPTLQQALAEVKEGNKKKTLEEAGTPTVSDIASSKSAPEWNLAASLRIQILRAMEALPENDAARKATVHQVPPERKQFAESEADKSKQTPSESATHQAAKAPSNTPLRLQEFQNKTTMSVSIFSKGARKDQLKVDFSPRAVHLDPLPHPDGNQRPFQLDLWNEIDTAASKVTILPSKVELSLVKKTPGKWPQLRAEEDAIKSSLENNAASDNTKEQAQTSNGDSPPLPTSSVPSYPSSSRSGPKNWGSIGADEADEDEGDVNLFFKKLYKNATPEQQRAMMKSFTESNGTSLSTDWNDVKARKIETVPPEGVEAKQWD